MLRGHPAAAIMPVFYRRVRRTIGFRKVNTGRPCFRIGLSALAGLPLPGAGFVHPVLNLADAAGIRRPKCVTGIVRHFRPATVAVP
jgi:hypothetical protein